MVTLNETAGLSHAKVAFVLRVLSGIGLTRGAGARVVLRAAGRLEPADREACHGPVASARLTPDETGWRVGGQPAWLHAWVGDRVTVYAVEEGRSAAALGALIGLGWAGLMTHDGFSWYGRFSAATHQQCLGHVPRRTRELLARATRGAVHYPRRLIALLTEAIRLRT